MESRWRGLGLSPPPESSPAHLPLQVHLRGHQSSAAGPSGCLRAQALRGPYTASSLCPGLGQLWYGVGSLWDRLAVVTLALVVTWMSQPQKEVQEGSYIKC